MSTEPLNPLHYEWSVLQNQADSYEKYSLMIKLVSVIVCCMLVFHQQLDFVIAMLCLVCWLLDAIWKTFQSRIFQRLEVVEQAILDGQTDAAMQFNLNWKKQRGSVISLLVAYVIRALTPTVLLPHIIISGLAISVMLIG